MKISNEGLALIMRFEGFSAKPYFCPAGFLTIGYGHLVRNADEFKAGITQEMGQALLRKDITRAEFAVMRYIKAPLEQNQFDALVSFTFNLGAGALQRSTLRAKVNRGEHEDVPAEFLKWVWAGGKKQKGLIRRRNAEADLYRSGKDVIE